MDQKEYSPDLKIHQQVQAKLHWCLEKYHFECLEMDLANLQHHLLESEHLVTDVKEDREVHCYHFWKIVKLYCVQSPVIAKVSNDISF